ncbi:MAG: PadR family transcriptional regulator, partial [Acidimicrobiales bacterium]
MIELAILGLLHDAELHGYELNKRLGELLGAPVAYGSLYPALSRLERAGCLKAVEAQPAPQPSMPMTGSLKGELAAFADAARPAASAPDSDSERGERGRRARRVYGSTARGRERLRELLLEPARGAMDHRGFALVVAFCALLEPAERVALFERRRAELARRLDERRRRRGG